MPKIIVTPYSSEFSFFKAHIEVQKFISMDTETTGLYPYSGDKLFCITVSTLEHDFYFDFNHEQQNTIVVNGEHVLSALNKNIIPNLLNGFTGTIFAHNAKFDMHFLDKEGLELTKFDVHCTEAIGRLVDNTLFNYSLEQLVRPLGLEKGKEVDTYIKKHKLYKTVKGENAPCFNLVPFEFISPYAMTDTNITLRLGLHQIKELDKQAFEISQLGVKSDYNLHSLYKMEKECTKALFRMEKKGILIDKEYTKEAMGYEIAEYKRIERLFFDWCGIDFYDKKTVLVEAFTTAGEKIPMTAKGNPCLDAQALEGMDSPLATMVKDWRRSYKMAHTYYENFLFFADKDGRIHPNFKQAGAKTGRMSCSSPNMQNCPSKGEDTARYPVRKCFIPDPGTFLVSIDWKAMEYRLMLDYAGEKELIAKVKAGHDVHEACAQLVGLVRKIAKNVNFAILYGTGDKHLSEMINKTLSETKLIRRKYYGELPKVRALIEKVKRAIMTRGFIITHFGRKLSVYDPREKAYKGPNYLIQGGCADIMKYALVEVDKLLKGFKSFIVLTVHDELDIIVHLDELFLIEKIARIMSDIYEHVSLPMGVDVEYSDKNWHELKEFKHE